MSQQSKWKRPSICFSILVVGLNFLMGCGTTRMSDSTRTATEQLLISNAIDQSVSQLDFRLLAGKKVFFDQQYLEGAVDKGYLVSSMRQHLLASGCKLQEKREDATYIVEARSGAIGTDRHALLIGVPQMNIPAIVPGQPSQIPEIPLAKKTDQQGIAKIAVFAFNRVTGQRVWQSGVRESRSSSKDLWVFGAGPFQNGSIRQGTTFAGQPLPVPFAETTVAENPENEPALKVTEPMAWLELPRLLPDGVGPPGAPEDQSALVQAGKDTSATKVQPAALLPVEKKELPLQSVPASTRPTSFSTDRLNRDNRSR